MRVGIVPQSRISLMGSASTVLTPKLVHRLDYQYETTGHDEDSPRIIPFSDRRNSQDDRSTEITTPHQGS